MHAGLAVHGRNWCDETTDDCTPTLANGSALPSDPAHVTPVVDGTCNAAAGALVCTSGVCDTMDNECGYAVGDGPCTPGDAGVVCRSGACSTNGTCEPAGGCDVDADCSKGNWCDETTHTCTPQLANSSPMPTDPAHKSPTLNGTCNAPAGTLVCVSGVCDTKDNECGYANGDGPCTKASGPTVCRSGACSDDGKCEPVGGCNVDADCSGVDWCDESTHACTPPLANGQPIPTDPPHKSPALNGSCTPAAGALVCKSKVCDTKDNECGYADGDGPCTKGTGGVVCRSGACSADGTCEAPGSCNVNADCTNPRTPFCDPSTHTCEAAPDGGLDAGGARDGEAHDAHVEDAFRPGDAGLKDGAPGLAGGFVEGGGLSCDAAPGSRGAAGAWAALLAGVALTLRARRKRRESARPSE